MQWWILQQDFNVICIEKLQLEPNGYDMFMARFYIIITTQYL